MKGVYTLVLEVQETITVMVGKIGLLRFDRGLYLYVGSALGDGASSIEGRLRRHTKKHKKTFWHIDHLLIRNEVRLLYAIYSMTDIDIECEIVKNTEKYLNISHLVKKFGSSDCCCPTHLLKAKKDSGKKDLLRNLKKLFRELEMSPIVVELIKSPWRDVSNAI